MFQRGKNKDETRRGSGLSLHIRFNIKAPHMHAFATHKPCVLYSHTPSPTMASTRWVGSRGDHRRSLWHDDGSNHNRRRGQRDLELSALDHARRNDYLHLHARGRRYADGFARVNSRGHRH